MSMYEYLDPAVRFCLEAIAPGLFQRGGKGSSDLNDLNGLNGHLVTNNLQETNNQDKLQNYSNGYNTPQDNSNNSSLQSINPQEDNGLNEDEKDRLVAKLLSSSESKDEDIDVNKVIDSEVEKVLKSIL